MLINKQLIYPEHIDFIFLNITWTVGTYYIYILDNIIYIFIFCSIHKYTIYMNIVLSVF